MAKASFGCVVCKTENPDQISIWLTSDVRAEAERIGLAFAEAHQPCRRARVDTIGRLTACWCAPCSRARGEDIQRISSQPYKATRVISPEFRKNRQLVMERADWTCEICDLPLNREATPFDDLAPVADHIIPLRDGGTDDFDNLRAAHRWCNLRRESGFGLDQEIFEDARVRFLSTD